MGPVWPPAPPQDKTLPFPTMLSVSSSSAWDVGSQISFVLQVICGKCSEFKAENSRQSRVCRGCFLTEPVSPSSDGPTEPKQSTEVGGPGSWDQDKWIHTPWNHGESLRAISNQMHIGFLRTGQGQLWEQVSAPLLTTLI
jgi:hypothetical protein